MWNFKFNFGENIQKFIIFTILLSFAQSNELTKGVSEFSADLYEVFNVILRMRIWIKNQFVQRIKEKYGFFRLFYRNVLNQNQAMY